mmetsp:Transcript_82620/g.221521  ORF Transcript_82620/g.221521 Transcript_82620/m.221521 type:complete len:236 (+) Transcript_82620:172-879(+)
MTLALLTPSMGIGVPNHSAAMHDHGPMATTRQSHGMTSPSTMTAETCRAPPRSSKRTDSARPMRRRAPPAIAEAMKASVSSRGVTCAVAVSITEAFVISPSSQETGGTGLEPRRGVPPCTLRVWILRNDLIPRSLANSSCIRNDTLWSCSVSEPSPQPPARKPPAFPLAAAPILVRSTTVDGTPRFARWYAIDVPIIPPPKITIFSGDFLLILFNGPESEVPWCWLGTQYGFGLL